MDTISGGVLPTNGVVNLTIGASEIGYAILPNKYLYTTVAGTFTEIYTGTPGKLSFYIPKTAPIVYIDSTAITGEIIFNGNAELRASGIAGLTSIIAENTVLVVATGCALTAKSIGDMLHLSAAANSEDCKYTFTGGTSAGEVAINAYLQSEYGQTLAEIVAILVTTNGGTITLNA